jgi:antitoxin FitA
VLEEAMTELILRDVDEEIVATLRRRAAKKGRSVEAEHREILKEALRVKPKSGSLKQRLLNMPNLGRDEDFVRHRDRGRKSSL